MSETPAAEDQMTPALQSAAMARKKRRIARNKQRSKEEAADDVSFPDQKRPRTESDDASDDTSPVLLIDPETSKPKPHVTGIKKHSRYDPGVPMTRDELKAWRKEARRVRNRESAAASRLKNRERIDELESEVDALKAKYAAALKFICNLEAGVVNDSFTPQSLRQDLADMAVSAGLSSPRPATPDLRHVKTVVSPPMSPSSAGEEEQQQQHHAEEVNQKYQHIMDMISRPIAVKISGALSTSDNDNSSCDDDVQVVSPSLCSASSTTTTDSISSDSESQEDEHAELLDNPVDDPELGAFLMDTFDSLLETPFEAV